MGGWVRGCDAKKMYEKYVHSNFFIWDIFDNVRDAFCEPKGGGLRDYTGPEKKFLKRGGGAAKKGAGQLTGTMFITEVHFLCLPKFDEALIC